MFTKEKTGTIVGLDVDASSLAATEVRFNGDARVVRAVVAPLPPGAFHDGEVADPDLLSEGLRSAFAEHGLSKTVRLGVANQRVAFRTIRLPVIANPDEMDTAVRFQAQEEVPMPLDSAVLDYQVIGGVAGGGEVQKVDVAIVAARREMIMRLLEPVRKAGLRPVSVDLSAFGLIRALAGAEAEAGAGEHIAEGETFVPAVLYCNLGDVTNLAVARRFACLFARVSQFGIGRITARLCEQTRLEPDDARLWLNHVGLEAPIEQVEGDAETVRLARTSLEEGAGLLADELRLSLDYYGAQEEAVPVGPVVLAGPGSAIPGMVERLKDALAREVRVGRPAGLAEVGDAEAARLTTAYGLSLEQ